jgi:hypothetical protein
MAEEKYLAEYEKSAAGNYLKRSRGILENTITVTAAKTLIEEESGSTVFMAAGADNVVITLPALNAGQYFKFICKDSTAVVNIVQAAATEDFVGMLTDGVSTFDSAVSGDTKIIFATDCLPGDYVECTSDGTNWYVNGECITADAILFG